MFKVQFHTGRGWADLKSDTGNGTYFVEMYEKREAAEAEAHDFSDSTGDKTRVVAVNTPEEEAIYEDDHERAHALGLPHDHHDHHDHHHHGHHGHEH
jgi:hypothetical protein